MSVLSQITRGKLQRPLRMLVTGVSGAGKSTFCSGAPNPLFMDVERRTAHLDVARVEPADWESILQGMRELYLAARDGKPPYQTLVVDTLDYAELMLWAHLCKKNKVESIEDIGGGWGKGYTVALEEWRRFMVGMEKLRDVGVNVILVAHSEIRPFTNPEGDGYDQWAVKLHKKAAGLIVSEMDLVGFARFDDAALKKKGDLKAKGVSTGERILCFGHSAAYISKPGLGMPDQISLSWEEFSKHLNKEG